MDGRAAGATHRAIRERVPGGASSERVVAGRRGSPTPGVQAHRDRPYCAFATNSEMTTSPSQKSTRNSASAIT